MNFLKNAWYVAANSNDLKTDNLVNLTITGEPVLLYRCSDHSVVALADRCCHRLAPLSVGHKEGNNVRCAYHGILFNDEGKAIEIPGQPEIPEKACVRKYPAIEFGGWIWVWMGDPEQAEQSKLPPILGLDSNDWIMGSGQFDYDCNYELINNNLTDLGHLTWVHSASFGADNQWLNILPKVSSLPRGVRITRWLPGISPIPPLGKAAEQKKVDHWAELEYHVPGIFHFYNAEYPVGTAEKYQGGAPDKNDPDLLYDTYTQQAVTPMTERTTRYFYSWGPNARLGNEEDMKIMLEIGASAFAEDKNIIEAQQKNIDLDPSFSVMPTVHDKGVIMFQRLMLKLIREETNATP